MSNLSSPNVSMPKWPAWILLGTMALSAYPAVTASAPRSEATAPTMAEASLKPPAPVEAIKALPEK